jgi:hypothetical protein
MRVDEWNDSSVKAKGNSAVVFEVMILSTPNHGCNFEG